MSNNDDSKASRTIFCLLVCLSVKGEEREDLDIDTFLDQGHSCITSPDAESNFLINPIKMQRMLILALAFKDN